MAMWFLDCELAYFLNVTNQSQHSQGVSMSIDMNGVKLAKTPFWAMDLARILNRYLENDSRIPNNTVEFFVCESDEGKPIISVERQCLDLSDGEYQTYYDLACEVFSSVKDSAIKELENL